MKIPRNAKATFAVVLLACSSTAAPSSVPFLPDALSGIYSVELSLGSSTSYAPVCQHLTVTVSEGAGTWSGDECSPSVTTAGVVVSGDSITLNVSTSVGNPLRPIRFVAFTGSATGRSASYWIGGMCRSTTGFTCQQDYGRAVWQRR